MKLSAGSRVLQSCCSSSFSCKCVQHLLAFSSRLHRKPAAECTMMLSPVPLISPGGRDLEKLQSCSCPPPGHAGRADGSLLNAFAAAELMQNGIFTLPFTCFPSSSSLWFCPAPCAGPAPSLPCGPACGLQKVRMEAVPALNCSARAVSGSATPAGYSVFSPIAAALPSARQPERITLRLPSGSTSPSAAQALGSCSLTHTVWERVIISAMANWTRNNLPLRNSNDAPLKICFN